MNKNHPSLFYSTVDSQKDFAYLKEQLIDEQFKINEHIFQENNKELQHKIEIQEKDQEIRHKLEQIQLLEQELLNKNVLYLSNDSPYDDLTDFSVKSNEAEQKHLIDKSYFTQKTEPFTKKLKKGHTQLFIESLESKITKEQQLNYEMKNQLDQLHEKVSQIENQNQQLRRCNEQLELSIKDLTTDNDNINFLLFQKEQLIEEMQIENQSLKKQNHLQQKENEEKIQDLNRNTTSLIEICEDAHRERQKSQMMFSKIFEEDDLNKQIIDNLTKTKNKLTIEVQQMQEVIKQKNNSIKNLQNRYKLRYQHMFKKFIQIKEQCEKFFIRQNIETQNLKQLLQTKIHKPLKSFNKQLSKKIIISDQETQNKYKTPIKTQKNINMKQFLTYKKVHEYVDLKKHVKLIQKYQKIKQDTKFEIRKLTMQIKHLKEDLESKKNSFDQQKLLLENENQRLVNELLEKNLRFSLLQEEQESSLIHFRKLVKKQNVRLRFYEKQILQYNENNKENQTEVFPEGSLFDRLRIAGKLSKDWQSEGKVTTVKDQGQCGACWIFSAVGVIESQLLLDGHSQKDLSEQQPLNCALERYGSRINACDGSVGHIAITSIEETGIQLESQLPYKGIDQKCNSLKPTDTRFDIQEHYFIKQSGNMQEFLEMLYERPLATAIYISDLFFDYKQGTIDCLSEDFYTGDSNNHEVLAVGYNIDTQNPEKSYIKFKNQWNTSWGENGYFKFKLHNETGYISQKTIVNLNSQGYQEKLYLYFGPCGILRNRKDTFWVKLKS